MGSRRKRSICIIGKGDLGKTELACAMMHKVSPSKTYHFVNKVDRLRDVTICPGEGLVVDEAFLGYREIDDVKALLDIKKTRDVACRNRDGFIPSGTPRILSTNWSWNTFWPREVALEDHADAIRRRILWIDVTRDMRKNSEPSHPEEPLELPVEEQRSSDPEEDAFEDVFDHGFDMD